MDKRYSIEVNDEAIEMYGELTIEEAFDFLNFFDKKGFKYLIASENNSTISMRANSSVKGKNGMAKTV